MQDRAKKKPLPQEARGALDFSPVLDLDFDDHNDDAQAARVARANGRDHDFD
jgi:hypothetical protein